MVQGNYVPDVVQIIKNAALEEGCIGLGRVCKGILLVCTSAENAVRVMW